MSIVNKQLEDDLKEIEQLEHRKRQQDNSKKKAKAKKDERRKFIVGGIFLNFLPEFLCLQPQKSNEEDEQEFAPLINFLSALASDEKLVSTIKAKAAEVTVEGTIQKNGEHELGS